MADEGHETQARDLLVEHARRALIHELGTARVEAWLGKDGLHQHDVVELAGIVVESLWPVLGDRDLVDRIITRHHARDLAAPIELDPNDW